MRAARTLRSSASSRVLPQSHAAGERERRERARAAPRAARQGRTAASSATSTTPPSPESTRTAFAAASPTTQASGENVRRQDAAHGDDEPLQLGDAGRADARDRVEPVDRLERPVLLAERDDLLCRDRADARQRVELLGRRRAERDRAARRGAPCPLAPAAAPAPAPGTSTCCPSETGAARSTPARWACPRQPTGVRHRVGDPRALRQPNKPRPPDGAFDVDDEERGCRRARGRRRHPHGRHLERWRRTATAAEVAQDHDRAQHDDQRERQEPAGRDRERERGPRSEAAGETVTRGTRVCADSANFSSGD